MNQLVQSSDTEHQPSYTNWRPPGWIVGDPEEPYTPEDRVEDGVTTPGIVQRYAEFERAGYFTRGGTLTEKAIGTKDEQEARDVLHNNKLLRDAWNTHGVIWRLNTALTGQPTRVDPFWNQGTQSLPDLVVKLDGLSPLTDGMLTVKDARLLLEIGERFASGELRPLDSTVRAAIEARLARLDGASDFFPLNWRQHLPVGDAAAAANGPHSCTAKWLRCSAAYGEQEFSSAFVPDNGDGWFQSIAMTATLVVRLGRVPCAPPPGIDESSPRGASALCVWIPSSVRERVVELNAKALAAKGKQLAKLTEAMDSLLPEPTRRVLLDGKSIAVPLWTRPRAGTQYAIVQRGDLLDGAESIIDFGLTNA
jgi:hypothetical protein